MLLRPPQIVADLRTLRTLGGFLLCFDPLTFLSYLDNLRATEGTKSVWLFHSGAPCPALHPCAPPPALPPALPWSAARWSSRCAALDVACARPVPAPPPCTRCTPS